MTDPQRQPNRQAQPPEQHEPRSTPQEREEAAERIVEGTVQSDLSDDADKRAAAARNVRELLEAVDADGGDFRRVEAALSHVDQDLDEARAQLARAEEMVEIMQLTRKLLLSTRDELRFMSEQSREIAKNMSDETQRKRHERARSGVDDPMSLGDESIPTSVDDDVPPPSQRNGQGSPAPGGDDA